MCVVGGGGVKRVRIFFLAAPGAKADACLLLERVHGGERIVKILRKSPRLQLDVSVFALRFKGAFFIFFWSLK